MTQTELGADIDEEAIEEGEDLVEMTVTRGAYGFFENVANKLKDKYGDKSEVFKNSDLLKRMSIIMDTYVDPTEIPYQAIDWGDLEMKIGVEMYDGFETIIVDYKATEMEARIRALRKFFGDDFSIEDVLDFKLKREEGDDLEAAVPIRKQEIENDDILRLLPRD